MASDAFPVDVRVPAQSPSNPFGKARMLRRREHGTPGSWPCRTPLHAAVRSAPSRDRAEGRLIGACDENASRALHVDSLAVAVLGRTERQKKGQAGALTLGNF